MDRKKLEKLFQDFKASLEAAAASDDEDKVDDPKPSSSFSYFRPSAKKNPLKRLQAKKRESDLEKKKKEERKEREDDLEKKKKEERKKLFGKAMKVPNSFEKDLHCLAKKCLSEPVSKPANTKHLEKAGLWGRPIKFLENDDKLSVKNKIEQTFPELKGGFKMLKCNKNGKSLFLIGDGPLVDGRALKAVTTRNIYLCPIQKDIDVDEATSSGSSGEEDECNEECLVCGELVPLTLLTSHAQTCTVQQAEDDWNNFNTYDNDMKNWEPQAVLPAEALIKFEEHRERIMEYSDQEAYLDLEEKSNRISITRGAYVTDLMTASKNPVFIAKIKRPLVVTFVGEDGADGGGLRRNLLSMVIDHAKDVFYVDPDQVGIDQDELDELYFALSIFLGIGVIQEKLFPKFLLQTFNNLKSQYGRNFKYHPLNRGLALFDLDKVFEDKQFSALFADFPITVQNILESLNNDFKDARLTPELKMCHRISFSFFIQLLNNVEKGKVSLPTRKMTLTDVFLFYTGLKTIPVAFEGLKYDVNYKLNDSTNRFRPIAYTCKGCAQLTLPIVEKYEDMEEGWVDAVLNNENGFGLL